MSPRNTRTALFTDIDADLRRELRIQALREDRSTRLVVADAIRLYLAGPGKKAISKPVKRKSA